MNDILVKFSSISPLALICVFLTVALISSIAMAIHKDRELMKSFDDKKIKERNQNFDFIDPKVIKHAQKSYIDPVHKKQKVYNPRNDVNKIMEGKLESYFFKGDEK